MDSGRGRDAAVLTIHNDYPWIGDPRYGRMVVHQNGRRVGVIECGGHIDLNLSASGVHTIQVRLWWWFRSGLIHLELKNGDHRVIRADIDNSIPVGARMWRMGLHPHHALILQDGVDRISLPKYSEMARKRLTVSLIVSGAGFVMLYLGATTTSLTVIIAGVVVAAAGLAIGVPLLANGHRRPR